MLSIRTQRLLLRPFELADARAFAAYRSDPEVARYQSWTAPYALAAAQELITEVRMRQLTPPLPGEWHQIAIELAADQPAAATLIGDFAFRLHLDDARQADIGFTLARPYQHRGYATEAVRALLHHLFTELRLHRVTATCDAENLPSQRVLERIGMRREGHFVNNTLFKGAWGSEFAYAILRSEWQA